MSTTKRKRIHHKHPRIYAPSPSRTNPGPAEHKLASLAHAIITPPAHVTARDRKGNKPVHTTDFRNGSMSRRVNLAEAIRSIAEADEYAVSGVDKIENNTFRYRTKATRFPWGGQLLNCTKIRHFDVDVVTLFDSGAGYTCGGYFLWDNHSDAISKTTRDRLNTYIPRNLCVYQHKKKTFVWNRISDQPALEFFDSFVWNRNKRVTHTDAGYNPFHSAPRDWKCWWRKAPYHGVMAGDVDATTNSLRKGKNKYKLKLV